MSAGILKRALAVLLLAALSLSAAGCANWEEMDDPLGELSEFYSQENEQPEPEPETARPEVQPQPAPEPEPATSQVPVKT